MNLIRRILSMASARSGGAARTPPARGGLRGRGNRGAAPQPTGLAALRGLLRRR